jgi:predicted ATPase/signal transduction histidine kinase/DNA-binding response OmpR family regulator/tRNA A-37 threonylcarbamoyl transferase component Bud32
MVKFSGYKNIDELFNGRTSSIYRAIQSIDNKKVILKVFKEQYPSTEETTIRKKEYNISSSCNIEGILEYYSIKNQDNQTFIVMEDIDGVSFDSIIPDTGLELKNFLNISVKLAEIIARIHQENIIHKDINPNNILINPKSNIVKIIDFGLSSRTSSENPKSQDLNKLEGTLTYISPEQSGRMNRCIDYRTDLYSLGITFYEALSGRLPFQSSDPMEIVHNHIARNITPLSHVKPEIPITVSNIVSKLLSKNPVDRYQGAFGLKNDLEKCQVQLKTKGLINDFAIGRHDPDWKFNIPDKLYGRKKEIELLVNQFDFVNQGNSELALIKGSSGVGKTALVNEIHKPIVKNHGFFVHGKCDNSQKDMPFFVFVQIFTELIRYVLTQNEEKVDNWKNIFLDAFSSNGQIIIDVVPEIEIIIGKQAAVQELPPQEEQNRFILVFKNFISCFASEEHPLVVFLDDLQWADSASLSFIKEIITDSSIKYFYLIGAYRDKEVNQAHLLTFTLEEIEKTEKPINIISLDVLKKEHISQLLSESLHRNANEVISLSQIIHDKTNGNPFFVNQFLQTLYQENLLEFNIETGAWIWDIEKLKETDITDNVIDLMIEKIKKLPSENQHVLKLSSCIGQRFDLRMISIIFQKSPYETFSCLWAAIEAGLVVPLDNNYKIFLNNDCEFCSKIDLKNLRIDFKFLHDQVHQAAYSMIPLEENKPLHLKIGQISLAHLDEKEKNIRIFETVNHFNKAQTLIKEQSKKLDLAKLNYQAGIKAIKTTAYQSGLSFLQTGISLLPENKWEEYYDLTFNLYLNCSECEYLTGNLDRAEKRLFYLLDNAKSKFDTADVYIRIMRFYQAQTKTEQVIKNGIKALALFKIKIPYNPNKAIVAFELLKTRYIFRKVKIEQLSDRPELKDPELHACMKLLMYLTPAAYISGKKNLNILCVLKCVNISLRNGHSAYSSYAYAAYAVALGSVMGKFQESYRVGKMALKLADQIDNLNVKCQTQYIFTVMINHWSSNIKTGDNILKEAYKNGMESGNYTFAIYAAASQIYNTFSTGKPLENVELEYNKYINFIKSYKNTAVIICAKTNILCASGLSTEKIVFSSNKFINETTDLVSTNTHNMYYIQKLRLLYYYENYENALNSAFEAAKTFDSSMGSFILAELRFFTSLSALALYPLAKKPQKKQLLKIHKKQIKQMKIWAANSPENYQNKLLLMLAEEANILKRDWNAAKFYEQSAMESNQNGFLQDEALCYELTAKFYLSRSILSNVSINFKKAVLLYSKWGAKVKVKDLQNKYPEYCLNPYSDFPISTQTRPVSSSSLSKSEHKSITTPIEGSLDMSTIMKATQTISSEIQLENLLKKMIELLKENAGADKCILILKKDNKFFIEAEQLGETKKTITVMHSIPIESSTNLSLPVVQFAIRTKENIVIDNSQKDKRFYTDSYLLKNGIKSILCMPIIHQGALSGILYLENNMTTAAFTSERLEVLKVFSSQIAISLENAHLYQTVKAACTDIENKNIGLSKLDKLKDEFLANISHELRTPLHGIIGLVESVLDESKNKLTDNQRVALSMVISSGVRLNNLVNGILDFSKLKHSEIKLALKPVDIKAIVNIVITLLQSLTADKPLQLINSIPSNIPAVLADEDRLHQIIYNLIGNAIKFTSIGKIEISAHQVGDFLEISVIDTGIGIEKEKIDRIFKSFEQADGSISRKYQGAGLGLAICKQLIELHQGEIFVNSDYGNGSDFRIRLPITDEIPESAKEPVLKNIINEIQPLNENLKEIKSITESKKYDPTIMIVDDEPVNLTVLISQLSSFSNKIIKAGSGKEALEKLNKIKPDLILLDIMMPDMDGYQVCKKIREKYSPYDLPIIFLTARNQVSDMVNGLSLGANDYLTKPVSKNELLARVKTQVELSQVKARFTSLRNFSNQISQFQDLDSLLSQAAKYLDKQNIIENTAIFYEHKLIKIKNSNDKTKLNRIYSELPEEPESFQILKENNNNYIIINEKLFENYIFIIACKSAPAKLEIEYIKNIFEQVITIRKNIRYLSKNNEYLNQVADIVKKIKSILYIYRKDGNYLYVTYSKNKFKEYSLDLNFKNIQFYFNENSFIQIHKSFLVNPGNVKKLEKKGRDFKIIYAERKIPISRLFLPRMRINHPDWFNKYQ